MKIHIVQQGDTLWKLSKKYNVDFEQLKAVNSHLSNPDVIMPGMKIKIPTAGVPVKKEAIKEQPIKQPSIPKEQPKIKEAPVQKKEVKVPPPKMPEEVKQPVVQQPVQMQPMQPVQMQPMPITQQQLYDMDLNFNIYKPMQPPAPPAPPKMPAPPAPAPPAPPKMPVEKELPKFEKPTPVVPKKEIPVPPPKPAKEEVKSPITAPITAPQVPSYQMPQQNCYPVTGVMPGCYNSFQPMMQPYHGYPQYPMMPQAGAYGYPQYPVMPQAGAYGYQPPPPPMPMSGYMGNATGPQGYPTMGPVHGGQPPTFMPQNNYLDDEDADEDDQFQGLPPMMPGQQMPMQPPPNYWGQPNAQPLYGDISMPQQPMPQMPQMPFAQQSPYGYPAQPRYQQAKYPYTGMQYREEEEDETEN